MRVDFGFVRVGRRSKLRTVAVPNPGQVPLRIERAELAGPYADEFRLVAEDFSGVDIYPERSCTVGLRFVPKGSGVRRAQLLLHTNGPGSPLRVVLTGYAPVVFSGGVRSLPALAVQRGRPGGWLSKYPSSLGPTRNAGR